jgi:hypothetical protein
MFLLLSMEEKAKLAEQIYSDVSEDFLHLIESNGRPEFTESGFECPIADNPDLWILFSYESMTANTISFCHKIINEYGGTAEDVKERLEKIIHELENICQRLTIEKSKLPNP